MDKRPERLKKQAMERHPEIDVEPRVPDGGFVGGLHGEEGHCRGYPRQGERESRISTDNRGSNSTQEIVTAKIYN